MAATPPRRSSTLRVNNKISDEGPPLGNPVVFLKFISCLDTRFDPTWTDSDHLDPSHSHLSHSDPNPEKFIWYIGMWRKVGNS
jgi:hypothetical protein